jgi:hypothetical protein
MMNDPRFYIFGVPDGFNMLSGTPDEILYYQLFYDTTKKGRELRINRKPNGEVIYSFLIYDLVSCKGREGAFLGMSIVFDKEYCNNPLKLKKLFEGIFNEVILKAEENNEILSVINGNNAIGKFCIQNFEERREMCEKIGRIIVNNVVTTLAEYIVPTDSSFDNSKEGRIITLPLETDNKRIIQALREYTWVSLSSECSISEQPVDNHLETTFENVDSLHQVQDLLSVHFIKELNNKISTYKDFIIQGLKGLTSLPEISSKRQEINNYLDTIEEYVVRQPKLMNLKKEYLSLYKELDDMMIRYSDINGGGSDPKGNGGGGSDLKGNGGDGPSTKEKIIKYLCIFGACVVLAAVLYMFLGPKETIPKNIPGPNNPEESIDNDNNTDDASVVFDESAFNLYLENADYKAAWSLLQNEKDSAKSKLLALNLQISYNSWFYNELDKRKKNINDLKELKNIIASYRDFIEIGPNNNLIDSALSRKSSEGVIDQNSSGSNRGKRTINSNETLSQDSEIKIYRSDINWSKGENIDGYNISCKRREYFIVEGGTRFSNHPEALEVSKGDNQIRIIVKKVGQYKITINQNIELTFNASQQ